MEQRTRIRQQIAQHKPPVRQITTQAEDDEYEDVWPPPVARSFVRYDQPIAPGVYTNGTRQVVMHTPIQANQIPKRRSAVTTARPAALPQPHHQQPAPTGQRPQVHWLFILGLGMLAMLALWYGVTSLAAWWTIHQDDMTYGRPRTFQFDAVVGHNDSPANPTHFIFINLNRHIEIIEQPGGDGSHARIYLGPTLYGDGQDITPVTGRVYDVNGDGKPDLLLYIQDQTIVFMNDGTQFKQLQPSQQNTIHLPPH